MQSLPQRVRKLMIYIPIPGPLNNAEPTLEDRGLELCLENVSKFMNQLESSVFVRFHEDELLN